MILLWHSQLRNLNIIQNDKIKKYIRQKCVSFVDNALKNMRKREKCELKDAKSFHIVFNLIFEFLIKLN